MPFQNQPMFTLVDSSGNNTTDPYILQLWDETTGRIIMSIPFIKPGMLVEQNEQFFTISYGGDESQQIYFESAATMIISNVFSVNGEIFQAVMTLTRSRNASNDDDDYGESNSSYSIGLSSLDGKTFRIAKCEASYVQNQLWKRQLNFVNSSYTGGSSNVTFAATSDSLSFGATAARNAVLIRLPQTS